MRRILILIVVTTAIIMIGIAALFHNRSDSMENLVIYNDKQVSMAPIQSQTEPQLLADGNGTVYEWSNHSLRKHGESASIVDLPSAVFPVSDGIGFIKNHCLYHYNTPIGTKKIANNVSTACWDGENYIWVDKEQHCVYEMANGGNRIILALDEKSLGEPEIILASSKWIIIGPYRNGNYYQSLLIYDRQEELSTVSSINCDGCDYAFLCEDRLIKIGGKQDTFCCFDLKNFEKTNYETGIVASQGVITASAAYNQSSGVFYVSVNSKPEQPEYYESNAATIAINFHNNSINIINNQFYNLGISNGSVYGIKNGLFGYWKTVLLSNK